MDKHGSGLISLEHAPSLAIIGAAGAVIAHHSTDCVPDNNTASISALALPHPSSSSFWMLLFAHL
jgi:hypothetical protein